MIINDFREDDCEISEEEVVNILKGIYNGTASNGLYIGGSLCYTHKVAPADHPNGKDDFLFTFHPGTDVPEEVDYWISKLYLQNKGEDAFYWKMANEAVIKYELKNKEKV
jgi:hypothetical protein